MSPFKDKLLLLVTYDGNEARIRSGLQLEEIIAQKLEKEERKGGCYIISINNPTRIKNIINQESEITRVNEWNYDL